MISPLDIWKPYICRKPPLQRMRTHSAMIWTLVQAADEVLHRTELIMQGFQDTTLMVATWEMPEISIFWMMYHIDIIDITYITNITYITYFISTSASIYIYTWEARYIISSDWWQKSRGVPGVVLQDRELRYREKIARDRAQSLESYSGSAQRGEMLWQWWNSKKNQEDFITCSSLFYVYIHTCCIHIYICICYLDILYIYIDKHVYIYTCVCVLLHIHVCVLFVQATKERIQVSTVSK